MVAVRSNFLSASDLRDAILNAYETRPKYMPGENVPYRISIMVAYMAPYTEYWHIYKHPGGASILVERSGYIDKRYVVDDEYDVFDFWQDVYSK